MNTIYLDFDGTIVDVNYRYFGIFYEFIDYRFSLNVEFKTYIKLKRSGLKDHQILNNIFGNFNFNVDEYVEFKRQKIEDLAWLKTDKLIGNPLDFAKSCNNHDLQIVLLTQRNNFENLNHQLSFLNIKNIFKDIFIIPPKSGINVKFEFLRKYADNFDIIIGDSKAELDAGNKLGIPSYFVNTGLYDSSIISGDTIFLNNYSEFLRYLI